MENSAMAAARDSDRAHLESSFPPVSVDAPSHVADAALLDATIGADSNAHAADNGTSEGPAPAETGVSVEPLDDAVAAPPDVARPPKRRALGSVAGLFFTIKPLLEGSLFADAPAVSLERCAHRFEQLHALQPFVWVRQLAHFSYALLIFSLFMTVTIVFFDISTSQWFHLLFTVPWIFFIICEMTFGDRKLMRVLWQFFDSWFLMANLLIMFVCVAISLFSKDSASPSIYPWATSLQHEQSAILISYCIIFSGSLYATCFDVIQKSPIGGRVRITMEILLICVFVRILAVDKFVRPMLEAKPVSWLYETDTRALMLQAIQNATIFFACHLVKYFRGGTSSILKLSITLWPIPRQSDGDEIAFMIALYGSPILVESQAVRAVTEKYDAALDALLSPEAAVAAAVADFDESRHRRDSSNHDGLLIDAETAAADGAAVEMMVASFSGTLPQQEQAQRDQQQEQDHGQEAASIDDPACPDDITVESVESASAPSAELEPLTSVKLVYRPLLPIDPRKMNKLYFHPAYAVFFWTTCVFTILMFGLTSWNPVTVPHFTLMMMVWTTLIVLEYGRLDRALLFHCIKSFDFVFLLVYLGGFVTFQLYTVLNDASSFEDTRPAADILRANIAANFAFFFTNLFAFLTDAAPTRRRANKIFLFIAMVVNVIRLLIFDFVRNGTSYSFPRNVRIGGSDVRQLQLGFLLPMMLFEIRYVCNLIANPMDLSLLKVNVKVIDSRSGLAETSDHIDSAEAAS